MKNKAALFSLGFRPFFLVATVFAFFAMFAWVAVYLFSIQLSSFSYFPMIIWHAHEMVFAYSMAVVAGFLLTAIKNWTGKQTVNGFGLMLLVTIWIVGRVAPFMTNIPWLIAVLEMLFLPVLAIFIAIPLVRVRNKRNYLMIALVLIMAALNLLVHLDMLGVLVNMANLAIKTAFYLIIALIIIMAGRVFPMFSQNGVANKYQVRKYSFIEKLVLPSYLFFMLSIVFMGVPELILLSSLIAAVIHAVRLKGWYNHQIWQVPLVWILHVGYLFLIIGFIMSAISVYKPSLYFMALHSFSIGTLGVVTIAMMARVSIGHTGRNLMFPPKIIKPIFLLMIAAVITRSIMPLFVSGIYKWTIIASGLMWSLAFLLFALSYVSIWIKPRIDEL
ncbi:MAG: NnrS family protein [Alcanivoracaceae bacterium]|nr:NnrS family protein [Alcanivoracaceae bacterium]